MKKTRRTSKVGENIRDALVEVFRRDLRGVDVGLASINEVEVSPDLRLARVYMTGLNEDETRATVEALKKAKGHVRHALGKRIQLRYTPELDFRYDETAMRAGRIELILSQVLPKSEPETTTDDDQPEPESDEPESEDEQS